MINLEEDFIVKFKLIQLEIKRVGAWIISLRPHQPTLGACVITLNRECEKLSNITEQEGAELTLAFKEIEKILNATFKPDKINYLALMMQDNQVHFHILPRYSNDKFFENQNFIDINWPEQPSLEPIVIDDFLLQKILKKLKNT